MPGPGVVEEIRGETDLPLWHQPEWQVSFPWLVQGTSGRGEDGEPFDLGLFGTQSVGGVMARWERLREVTGMRRAVHARQVHQAELRAHGPGDEPGLLIGSGYDGHLTRAAGVLLTVSVADCVPVFIVEAATRSVALVHAGWRSVAAGIVERAVDRIRTWTGDGVGELWVHCGPAICGACYEVGPEVHEAVLPSQPPPEHPAPIDLRRAIGDRVALLGVPSERITISAHCTRCGPGSFFSHRGGSAGRQMALLGVRV